MTSTGFYRKALLILSLPILTASLNSCYQKQKDRIEVKFEKFVDSSFANPNDYIEIASIELIDSGNVYQLAINAANVINLDSLYELELSMAQKIGNLTDKIPYPYKRDYAQKAIPLASKMFALVFKQKGCKEKRDLLLASLNDIDSAKTTLRKYMINVREKRDGEIIMKRYTALDCIMVDSILFSESDIDFSSVPAKQLQEIFANAVEYKNTLEPRINVLSEANALLGEYQMFGL